MMVIYIQNIITFMHLGTNITLSGADGSGKFTTIRFLALYFSRYGNVCVHWFRGSLLFVSVLARFLHKFRSFRGSCNPYYRICVPEKLKKTILLSLAMILLLIVLQVYIAEAGLKLK